MRLIQALLGIAVVLGLTAIAPSDAVAQCPICVSDGNGENWLHSYPIGGYGGAFEIHNEPWHQNGMWMDCDNAGDFHGWRNCDFEEDFAAIDPDLPFGLAVERFYSTAEQLHAADARTVVAFLAKYDELTVYDPRRGEVVLLNCLRIPTKRVAVASAARLEVESALGVAPL